MPGGTRRLSYWSNRFLRQPRPIQCGVPVTYQLHIACFGFSLCETSRRESRCSSPFPVDEKDDLRHHDPTRGSCLGLVSLAIVPSFFFFGVDWQTTTPGAIAESCLTARKAFRIGLRTLTPAAYLWGYILRRPLGHHAFAVNG